MSRRPVLTVVAPFFNEVDVLPSFCQELRCTLDALEDIYEVVLVDDGSTDGSFTAALDQSWPQLTVIRLSANVGHQSALEAGLHVARGDLVVTMDADLQHPPNVVPQLVSTALDLDVDVVYAVRCDRSDDNWFKRFTARWYYRIIRTLTGVPIVDHAADFRLVTRFVVDIVNNIPEKKVFRLLIPSLGFSSTTVSFQAATRRAGHSKYGLRKMLSLALRSSVQFSPHPLRLVALLGLATSVLAFVWLVFVIGAYLAGSTLGGWPSLMSVTLVLGGIILFSLGVVGEYVGEIFESVKGRPHFIIRSMEGEGTSNEPLES